jgi:NDP-sugar pyrophosphorylase family protein
LTLPVAILAGGLGTRLGVICRDKPKALVEVAGAPFIHHQLRLLKRNGIERVVILTGYLGSLIEDSVGDGSAFGLKALYSQDWPDLLGTGGAILKALDLLGDKFLVIYGDSYLEMDYQAAAKAFLNSNKPALMAVWRNDDKFDKSNVVFDNGEIKLYDKGTPTPGMNYIDYGLGGLSAQALNGRSGTFDLAEVYTDLSRQGLLTGLEVSNRFYEIGSLEGLVSLDVHLRKQFYN